MVFVGESLRLLPIAPNSKLDLVLKCPDLRLRSNRDAGPLFDSHPARVISSVHRLDRLVFMLISTIVAEIVRRAWLSITSQNLVLFFLLILLSDTALFHLYT